MKSYKELITLQTYDERLKYLQLGGTVGFETFGPDRHLNQMLYSSPEWKRFRREVILRDKGCDLGLEGYDVHERLTVHHINPVTVEMIMNRDPLVFDLDNAISASDSTHKAIHYHSEEGTFVPLVPKERSPSDTSPWKKAGGQNGR